jgi:hypothetical protein
MKKTCVGRLTECKALISRIDGDMACKLGYKMTSTYNRNMGVNVNPRPLEDCPKPMTWKKLFMTSTKQELLNERKPEQGDEKNI